MKDDLTDMEKGYVIFVLFPENFLKYFLEYCRKSANIVENLNGALKLCQTPTTKPG